MRVHQHLLQRLGPAVRRVVALDEPQLPVAVAQLGARRRDGEAVDDGVLRLEQFGADADHEDVDHAPSRPFLAATG